MMTAGATQLVCLLFLLAWLPCSVSDPQQALLGQHATTFLYQGVPGQPLQLIAPESLLFPAFQLNGSTNFELQHVILEDRSGLAPSVRASNTLEQLLLLPWLGQTGASVQATLQDVQIRTSCKTVQAFQEAACSIQDDQLLRSLTVLPGSITIPQLTSSNLNAQDILITCNPPASTAQPTPAPTTTNAITSMACAVVHVANWNETVMYTGALQPLTPRLHLIVDSPLIIPSDFVAQHGSIQVVTKISISRKPGLALSLAAISMDPVRGEGVWTIAGSQGQLLFNGIVFAALPFGPQEKYPLSILPWGMWFVRQDRCQHSRMAVTLDNCTLIVQPQTMDYMSYWAGELLSVFPNKQQAAQWYGVDFTCNPPYERPLLQKQPQDREQEIKLADQANWEVLNSTTLGIKLHNIIVTSRPVPGVPNTYSSLPLTQLFDEAYLALPYITMVSTPEQLVRYLVTEPTSYLVLLSNISVPRHMWPPHPVKLSRNVVVSGWPNRPTVLDWQGLTSVLDANGFSLEFRNVVLLNGGQAASDADIPWATNLTMYQWPIKCSRSNGQRDVLRLVSVTLVVPPSELAIIRTCMTRFRRAAALGPAHIISQGACELLSWVKSGVIKSDQACSFPQFQDSGLSGANVTLSDVPIAFPLLNQDVMLRMGSDFVPASGDPAGSGSHGWSSRSVLPVVLPVVACVVVLACVVVWVIMGKSKKKQGEAADPGWSKAADIEQQALGDGDGQLGAEKGGDLQSGSLPGQHTARATPTGLVTFSQVQHAADTYALYHNPSGQGKHTGEHVTVVGVLGHTSLRPESVRSQSGKPSGSTSSLGTVPLPLPLTALTQRSTSGHPSQQHAFAAAGAGSAEDLELSFVDSFENVTQDPSQLLVNKWGLGGDQQNPAQAPDVASQLKTMVSHMQDELGDQEVQITQLIGQGGGGVVHQGIWRGLVVAVKSLVFTVVPSQPMSNRQQRAMTEAAICKTLQHPNIVATYSYDLQALHATKSSPGSVEWSAGHSSSSSAQQPKGSPVPWDASAKVMEFKLLIIQEYCDGGTLKTAIDDGRLVPGEAAEHLQDIQDTTPRPDMAPVFQIALDVAMGMCHVHLRNIVHGDLTPANVLLKTNANTVSGFTAKVADFGLSWKLSSGKDHVSNAQQGTGFYISPEVLHVGIMSKAADVFSFGMILHEMYHGTPFWRRRHGLADAAAAVLKGPGMDQLSWAAHCPAPFKSLVTACLSPNPQARPSFESITRSLQAMQGSCQLGGGGGGGGGGSVPRGLPTVQPLAEEGEPAESPKVTHRSCTQLQHVDSNAPAVVSGVATAGGAQEEQEQGMYTPTKGLSDAVAARQDEPSRMRGSPASCPEIQADSDFERSIEQQLSTSVVVMRPHLTSRSTASSKDMTGEAGWAGHDTTSGTTYRPVSTPGGVGSLQPGAQVIGHTGQANVGQHGVVGMASQPASSTTTPTATIVLYPPGAQPVPVQQQGQQQHVDHEQQYGADEFPLQPPGTLSLHPSSSQNHSGRPSNMMHLDGYLLQPDKTPEACSMQSLSSPVMGQGPSSSSGQPEGHTGSDAAPGEGHLLGEVPTQVVR